MLNLNDASEEKVGNSSKFQEVGIYDNIRITGVIAGESNTKKTPFVKLEVEGANGEKSTSAEMYVSTTIKDGSTMSAWNITARNLVGIIKSITGKSEQEAKDAILAKDNKDLASKLATLLVGKPFRAVFYGKEIQGKEGKNNWVKATMMYTESMKTPISQTKLKFDVNNSKHMEKLPIVDPTTVVSNDLPW